MVGEKSEGDKLDDILPVFEIRSTQFSDNDVVQSRGDYMRSLENVFSVVCISVDVVPDAVEPKRPSGIVAGAL